MRHQNILLTVLSITSQSISTYAQNPETDEMWERGQKLEQLEKRRP